MSRPDPETAAYVLALADDALVLAQRCGEWIAAAPEIEEDIALGNIGLDLLGQARLLLTHAGELEGRGRDEDALAYFRSPVKFRNALLCELPNGDFGFTIARLLSFSAYAVALYTALSRSTDPTLAAIAAKAVKEVTYHADHATRWVIRLGDGTTVSHARMQAGVDSAWPYLLELFDDGWVPDGLVETGIAVLPSTLADPVRRRLGAVLAEATLRQPAPGRETAPSGGRHGRHTDELDELLAELQSVARAHPGAAW